MDAFLDGLDLYRSDVAKDGSCLFRAVSEQLFYTQVHHVKLRDSCVEYIIRNRATFEKFLNEDFDEYIEKIRNPKEWAGELEINALSQQYRIDFVVYHDTSKNPTNLSSDLSAETVTLSCTGGNRYDCVYTKSELSSLAFCQSIVYEVLYKDVFNLGSDVDMAVEKMLHDKAYSKQRRSNLLSHMFRDSCRIEDTSDRCYNPQDEQSSAEDPHMEIRKALAQGIPPFPYKVAKTLDPGIYRNVEFDLWNELRKEDQKTEQFVIPKLEPGVKCKVHFEKESCIGHIQEVHNELDKVTVYIEELCKRCIVSTEIIEIYPVPAYKTLTWQGGKTYKVYSDSAKSGQDKFKGRRYYKKNYQDYSTSQNGNVVPKTPIRSNSFSTPSDHSYNKGNNYIGSPQKVPRRRGLSHSTPLSSGPKTPPPQPMAMPGTMPQLCSAPTFTPMWNGMEQMLSTSPIPIPGNIPNAELFRKLPGSPESLNELNHDPGWIEDMTPSSYLNYLPSQQFALPQQQLNDTGYSSVCHSSTASSPLPIPHAKGMSYNQPQEEMLGGSPVQMNPATPTMTLYPYPVYTNMYLVCRDGSTVPISVAPWTSQETVQSGEQLSGNMNHCPQYAPVPNLYFNTPPGGMSPPTMTQWVHSSVPTWAPSQATMVFSPSMVGEMGPYHQPMMSPPWSPQSGIFVGPQITYTIPPPTPPPNHCEQQQQQLNNN